MGIEDEPGYVMQRAYRARKNRDTAVMDCMGEHEGLTADEWSLMWHAIDAYADMEDEE